MTGLERELGPGPARDLCDLFRTLRATRPLPNRKIAAGVALSPSYVSEILGGRKVPSPDVAARIARVLGGGDAVQMRARGLAEQVQELRLEQRRVGRVNPTDLTPAASNAEVAVLRGEVYVDVVEGGVAAIRGRPGAGQILHGITGIGLVAAGGDAVGIDLTGDPGDSGGCVDGC